MIRAGIKSVYWYDSSMSGDRAHGIGRIKHVTQLYSTSTRSGEGAIL